MTQQVKTIEKQCKENISSLKEATIGFAAFGLFVEAFASICPCNGSHIEMALVGGVALGLAGIHGWDWAKSYDELQEIKQKNSEENQSKYLFV